ncbi:nuclear transport factor 2 family protein [Streptomyces sp. NPDC003691]
MIPPRRSSAAPRRLLLAAGALLPAWQLAEAGPAAAGSGSAAGRRPAKDPKIAAVERFFAAYAANDVPGMAEVLSRNVEWTIPGHHPLAGTKYGIAEVRSFLEQLAVSGFRADPLFLEANRDYVVDIHRGWSTKGIGRVDTLWALVWHFGPDGKVDRVVNLSGDQHGMDTFVWANYRLAPLPDRLA